MNSFNNTIRHNFAFHNKNYGLQIAESSHNNITENEASNNRRDGIFLSESGYSILAENHVSHNGRNGFELDLSSNCTIIGNEGLNNRVGLFIYSSHNCLIAGNDFRNNTANGMRIESGLNNEIDNNTAAGNWGGIALWNSSIISIKNNTIIHNSGGMALQNSPINEIFRNNITGNKIGLYLNNSSQNKIIENIIGYNDVGLASNSSNNSVLNNSYINNTKRDMISRQNESISNNLTWNNAVLTEDPDSFLTGPRKIGGSTPGSKGFGTESTTGHISSTTSFRTLTILSQPSGAEIWVDGDRKGKFTPDKVRIKGKALHEIKLTLSGYESKIEEYEITAPTTINMILSPTMLPQAAPDTSGLNHSAWYATIKSVPEGAEIWIDDGFTGKRTPSSIKFNDSGVHSYELILSGYQNHKGYLRLSESSEENVSLVPKEKSPAFSFPELALVMVMALSYRSLKNRSISRKKLFR
jgi:parallel beta-helix repeat protein